jgi:hypothetical protein
MNLDDVTNEFVENRMIPIFGIASAEGFADALLLDKWLYRDYSALGYDVIRVPVLPPQERLGFILEKLVEEKLLVEA